MPLRRGIPVTFRPSGVCDAIDGTNAPPGAMLDLTNLVPDPAMAGAFVARPAAERLTQFGGITAPGFVSGRLIVGDIEYGMIASGRFAGKDEPYAYNLATGAFLTIAGINSGNVPASPPATGAWTPPILAQVGTRVIVCHPGFAGALVKFGWFDVSAASIGTLGDTVSGVPAIFGLPTTLGVQPGMTAAGANIPANTTVLRSMGPAMSPALLVCNTVKDSQVVTVTASYGLPLATGVAIFGPGIPNGSTVLSLLAGGTLTVSQAATATLTGVALLVDNSSVPTTPPVYAGTAHGTMTIDAMASTTGLFVGQQVYGAGLAVGSLITGVTANSITVNLATVAVAGTVNFNATGSIIVLSANATATADGTAITLAGGSASAPLWGAGDTDRNPLPSVPLGVAQMNGRAWFACGTDGIPYSDSLLPCVRSNSLAVQALTTSDGVAVTAIAPLMLSALLPGGIVQSLIAFQAGSRMQQIIGDQTTGDLRMNSLPVATGTLAPLSIHTCELGTGFVSPEGLRYVQFNGQVSAPIGDAGSGIAVPFIYAATPSRICAAAAWHTVRISVTNGKTPGAAPQEFWFDFGRKSWSGPHTFPASLIQPWRSTFVMTPAGITRALWQSDTVPQPGSSYVENEKPMRWAFMPSALPDTNQMAANALIDMTLACTFGPDDAVSASAQDTGVETAVIDTTSLPTSAVYQQQAVNWHIPLVFKQLLLGVGGFSSAATRIGNLYMRYQVLGYKTTPTIVLGEDLLLDDAMVPLVDDGGIPLLAA